MLLRSCVVLALAFAGFAAPASGNQLPAPSREIEGERAIRALEAAIDVYRTLAAVGGWVKVPAGKPLKPGEVDSRVESLRARLIMTGDAGPSHGALYDAALAEAVKRFQRRHGLADDAVVGRSTLEALNTPVEERIATLELNLERMKKLSWGDRYVAVNIPEAVYRYVDGDVVFSAPAIVGQPDWATPEIDSVIDQVELNPTWIVPEGIASRELWPKIDEDPDYLARNDMQIVDGKIQQPAGPKNPLGRVKFLFNNPHSVYLHDTNRPEFFAGAKRDRSHGCVRVSDPIGLAKTLLASDPAWPLERIDEVVRDGKTKRILLNNPIPVHLTYLTAWVSAAGTVEFRADVYGRDRASLSMASHAELYGD